MNRHHFLMLGIVLLFLGVQFYLVDTIVLTEEVTKVMAKSAGKDTTAVETASLFVPGSDGLTKKQVTPPTWLGWLLMSVGTVLILHSFAMPKPGG